MSKIGILVASASNNRKLGDKLKELATIENVEAEVINLVDLDLPLYSTVEEERNGIPDTAKELANKILSLKAFIIVAPEYNGVMPPVLNNAMAWTSRATESWRDAFNEKIVGLATHSGGGGNDVMQAMRTQFTRLGAIVLPREIVTTFQKKLDENSSERILKQFLQLL